MRETLLGDTLDEPTSSGRPQLPRLRFPRLRGGANEEFGCLGCLAVVVFVVLSLCVKSVSPLEYGLLKNTLSGTINEPVRGGLHFIWPYKTFIIYPATRITIEWSNQFSADGPPIKTRTGKDKNDPKSGGQPIMISCAIQFELVPSQLKSTYVNLGAYPLALSRFNRWASNTISNTAQDFIPQDFWTKRASIAAKMLHEINLSIEAHGAKAVFFEIMKVDFARSFEDSITSVQVATQQQVVNEYSQQVQTVLQQINVLNSENNAHIAHIMAVANKKGTEIVGNATRTAFVMRQHSKAQNYAKLQSALGFSANQMAEYIKIQSLIRQSAAGKVVVNIPPPYVATKKGSVGPSPR